MKRPVVEYAMIKLELREFSKLTNFTLKLIKKILHKENEWMLMILSEYLDEFKRFTVFHQTLSTHFAVS